MSRWVRKRRAAGKPLGRKLLVPALTLDDMRLLRRLRRTEGAWR